MGDPSHAGLLLLYAVKIKIAFWQQNLLLTKYGNIPYSSSIKTVVMKNGLTMAAAMARKARSTSERAADAALGKRLALLRRQRGYTQVELAETTGVVQTIISDYERGKLRPHPSMLVKLATALLISTDELLGMAAPKKDRIGVSRRFLRRLQIVDKLPQRDQEALLRTIDAFIAARKAK